jgi:acetyl esterase/lipase
MRGGRRKGRKPVTGWDAAFANAAHIPGGAEYPARWAAAAAAWRAVARGAVDQPYGRGERERFDLFLPAGEPRGTVVFVHGGYWRAFGRELWSHLAEGPVRRGWAVAIPSYDLCPGVRISAITRQISQAVQVVAARLPGPLVLTGHSAGGHLVARMGCADVALPVLLRVARIVPISPVADLRPLVGTEMNRDLRLDPVEAAAESPALCPAPGVAVHVWVGALERPVFVEQAAMLARVWEAGLTVAAGRHHFDVIEEMAVAESALCCTLLGEGPNQGLTR